jgi:hypothetical protein
MSRKRRPRFPPKTRQSPTGGAVRVCCAKKRGTDERCAAACLAGSDYCRLHSGGPQFGPDNPRYRGGVSKPLFTGEPIVPAWLVEAIDQISAQPELLELHRDVAALDVRLRFLYSRLAPGIDPVELANAIDAAFTAIRATPPDRAAVAAAFNRLEDLKSATHSDEATWSAIVRLIGKRARLVAAQRKFEAAAHMHVDRREMLRIATALSECVTKHIHDPQTLRPILDEFRAVIGAIRGESTIH